MRQAHSDERRWWNWYTRYFEGVVVARPCEFESHPAHNLLLWAKERWQSGRLRRSWKPLSWEAPGVRIPLSPQKKERSSVKELLFFFWEGTGPSYFAICCSNDYYSFPGRGLLSRLCLERYAQIKFSLANPSLCNFFICVAQDARGRVGDYGEIPLSSRLLAND